MDYLTTILMAIGLRMDAKFNAVLEKQLEYVKTKTYDVLYPELKGRLYCPVSNEADPGAETITYRQWDEFGMAQIISNYADDLPLIDALVEEFVQKVKGLGAAYQYSLQDLRRSAMANSRLDQRRANGARKAIELQIDQIAALGNANAGLTGIANNANVSLISPATGTWSTATGEQMVADMMKFASDIVIANKETIIPDTVVLDVTNYNRFANKRISTTGDTHTTALQAFLKSSPYIKNVGSWYKLATADAAGTGPRAICYKRDPEVLTLEVPQEFEQLPPQNKNLAFQVPVHARTGGVIVYYPIGMGYMDGL
jgi:hypothetical protein